MTAPEADARKERLIEEATAWFVRISVDGASEAERRAFEDWLRQDPAHPSAYAEAEALWSALGEIPDPRTAPVVTAKREPPGTPSRGRLAFAALAACLLLACAGLWMTGSYDRLRADHATAVGERRIVTLSDGSAIHLNTDTALAVELSETRRRIRLLQGEAFFSVARDPKRPFEVVSDDLVSRALGTHFVVRSHGGAEIVAVAEGRVRVSPRVGQARPESALTLGPGEALRAGDAAEFARQNADLSALTAWRDGKLVFADRPLRTVIAELDRHRPGVIVFLDSGIAETRFTGVLNLQDGDQALTAIERTLPVDALRITGYLTLLRARN